MNTTALAFLAGFLFSAPLHPPWRFSLASGEVRATAWRVGPSIINTSTTGWQRQRRWVNETSLGARWWTVGSFSMSMFTPPLESMLLWVGRGCLGVASLQASLLPLPVGTNGRLSNSLQQLCGGRSVRGKSTLLGAYPCPIALLAPLTSQALVPTPSPTPSPACNARKPKDRHGSERRTHDITQM